MLLNLIQENDRNLDNKKLDLNPIIMDYSDCKTTQEAINISNHYNRSYTKINSPNYNINKLSKLFSKLNSSNIITKRNDNTATIKF